MIQSKEGGRQNQCCGLSLQKQYWTIFSALFFFDRRSRNKASEFLWIQWIKKHKPRKDWKSDKCPQWMNIAWTVSIGHNDGYAEIYEDD